jgi:predicted DNA binding CopG/RHH family protein
MIWYVEENKTEVSYGNTIPRNFVVWYVEENFKPMNCNFEKIFQRVNVQIEKSAWTGLGKVKKKASSAASVFKMFISTTGHGSAFDKRCNSRYTLRGCVLADVQSREEFKDALAS